MGQRHWSILTTSLALSLSSLHHQHRHYKSLDQWSLMLQNRISSAAHCNAPVRLKVCRYFCVGWVAIKCIYHVLNPFITYHFAYLTFDLNAIPRHRLGSVRVLYEACVGDGVSIASAIEFISMSFYICDRIYYKNPLCRRYLFPHIYLHWLHQSATNQHAPSFNTFTQTYYTFQASNIIIIIIIIITL